MGQTQKYLLRLMLVDDEQRRRVREEGVEELFLDQCSRGLAQFLLDSETGGSLPETLDDSRLNDGQQSLLAGLRFQDDLAWAEEPERIFADCRRAVVNHALQARLNELGRLQKAAEDCGDEQALIRCQQERIEINQKLKKKL